MIGYYDSKKKIYVSCTGSLCAPTKDRSASIQRIYSMIENDCNKIRVHTRQFKEGAWEPYNNWADNKKQAFYDIEDDEIRYKIKERRLRLHAITVPRHPK